MLSTIYQLFAWMPTPLYAICCGVVAIFLLVSILRIVKLILDVIPFL